MFLVVSLCRPQECYSLRMIRQGRWLNCNFRDSRMWIDLFKIGLKKQKNKLEAVLLKAPVVSLIIWWLMSRWEKDLGFLFVRCGWHGLGCDRCFLCAAYLGSRDIQETFVVTGLVESWRAVFFMFLNFKILRRDFGCGWWWGEGVRAEHSTVLEGKRCIPDFLNCE